MCRKALHLLRHVIQAHPPDAAAACQLGAAQQAASCLASSDNDTWQAALLLIQQLTQSAETQGQLRQVSQSVIATSRYLIWNTLTLIIICHGHHYYHDMLLCHRCVTDIP